MAIVDLEIKHDTAVVRLNNGITNAISPELILALSKITDSVQNDCNAMILTGNDRFFSMGFDLPRVMSFDRPGLAGFLHDFQTLLFQMATLPVPVICAVTGHAVAGGAIMAIVCDYRIAKSEKVRIGFNESLLGLTVPYMAELMLCYFTGPRNARRLLVEGTLIKAENAVGLGLIDEVHPQDTLLDQALQKARHLMEIPLNTHAAIKQNQLEPIKQQYFAGVRSRTEQFMDLWFTQETRKRLALAMEKF